ncbi:MAG: hypothetical protein RL634_1098 [Bacteroidota bacterium]|jgi:Family of unknown function (DUF6364)|nr:hypothetical protein [Chitinophagia bacterium]
MTTKLTLSVDSGVIKSAKGYAKKHNMSLSKMVEGYLKSVSKHHKKEIELPEGLSKVSGMIKGLSKQYDWKKDVAEAKLDKYKKIG